MKKLLLFFCASVFITMACGAQTTKIMDSQLISSVNPTLIVYLTTSGSDCTSLHVEISATPGGNEIFNQQYYSGTNLIIEENTITIPLGSLSASAEKYVTLHLELTGSTQTMEYKVN